MISAYRAIAGSGECSREMVATATPSAASKPAASSTPTALRCVGSCSAASGRGPRTSPLRTEPLAFGVPLALFAQALLACDISAGLADRDEIEHRQCDRPDNDFCVGHVR